MATQAHGNARLHVPSVLVIATLISLFFIAIPLFYLIRRAMQSEGTALSLLIWRTKTLEILVTTLSLTIVVVILASTLGIAMAWALHSVRLPAVGLIRALVILPVAIPSYVFTFSWMSLYPALSGFWAAVFILVLSTTPYVSLATLSALRRVDWSQYEVAQTLGLNNWQSFWKVTLPQIRNSVAAGSLLVALYVLSDFGAVSLLGVDTFTRSISNLYRGSFDRSSAAVLALILVLISALLISSENRIRSKSRLIRSSSRIIKSPNLISKESTRFLSMILISLYVLLGLLIPLSLLVYRSVINQVEINLPDLLSASLSTVLAASLGALIALLLALPLGLLVLQGSWLARVA
ncbi:MAG: hypothetical protein RLY76_987, partial [Actinomycetota bacterium]